MNAPVQVEPRAGRPPAPMARIAAWRTFVSAPYRMLFCAGAVQLVAVMAYWGADLGARYGGWWPVPVTVVPNLWAHAVLMIYGLFPAFVFGFLLTVYPQWLATEVIAPRRYTPAVLLFAGGAIGLYPALFTGHAWVLTAGVVMAAGWALAWVALLRVHLPRLARARAYETVTSIALGAGLVGLIAALAFVATGLPALYRLAVDGGIWLFLLPILATVAVRMVPFLGHAAVSDYEMRRPAWAVPVLATLIAGHGAAVLAGADRWLIVFDLPVALAGIYLAWLWQPWRVRGVRLLVMLHIAFAWLPIGMTLFVVQDLARLGGVSEPFGLAPLHVLGMGFATSMLLAMATRVSLGLSERPWAATRLTWQCFAAMQVVMLLRVVAELAGTTRADWLLGSAALWLVATVAWSSWYAPGYWRPRVDGRPG